MQQVTLLSLRTLIQSRADITFDTDRHTITRLNLEINHWIMELRARLTSDGCQLYMAQEVGVLPTVPAGPSLHYAELEIPSECASIESIDWVDGAIVRTLESTTLRERLAFGIGCNETGKPEAWTLLEVDTGTAAIFPVPDSPYPYVMWYSTVFTELTTDASSWAVLPGFVDWVVWAVVGIVGVKDDLQALKQDAARGMDSAYRTALASARGMRRPEGRRRDTRSRREDASREAVERGR